MTATVLKVLASDDAECAADRCERAVYSGSVAWIDTLKGSVYCDVCGPCLRYARDRAIARGESIDSVGI